MESLIARNEDRNEHIKFTVLIKIKLMENGWWIWKKSKKN